MFNIYSLYYRSIKVVSSINTHSLPHTHSVSPKLVKFLCWKVKQSENYNESKPKLASTNSYITHAHTHTRTLGTSMHNACLSVENLKRNNTNNNNRQKDVARILCGTTQKPNWKCSRHMCVAFGVHVYVCMYIDYNNKLTGTTLGLSWHNVKLCSVRAFKYPRILTKSGRNLNKYTLI